MTTQNITARAMLISLSISYWTGKTGDSRMIDDITKVHQNERDSVEAKKLLINPAALNAPKAVRSRARAYFFEKTSPWIDGGTRVMAASFYFDMMEKMREMQTEYETAVDTHIIKNYAALKGEARKRLGSLYNEADYPTVAQLKQKYAWGMSVLPIPEKGDWRVNLGGKTDADVRKHIDEQVKQACEVVTRDLWVRLHAVVAKMSEKLKETDGVFRDTLVHNIKDLCAILPEMNVAGDPKLDAMIKDVEKALTQTPTAALRDDAKVRKAVKSSADELLEKMAGYIGGK